MGIVACSLCTQCREQRLHTVEALRHSRRCDDAAYRQLTALKAVAPDVTANQGPHGIQLTLRNSGAGPVVATKLTLLRADGSRVLPAYYSYNDVSLLPGEAREITVQTDVQTTGDALRTGLRGWNVNERQVPVTRHAAR